MRSIGDRRWTVYLLRDPFDGRVRYVGWTVQSLRDRLRRHCREAARATHHRARWIAAVVAAGGEPLISAVQRGAGDGWADAERAWIARCRAAGADLTNATDGGDCGPGFTAAQRAKGHATPRSAEARANMAAAAARPEVKARRSAAQKVAWARRRRAARSDAAPISASPRRTTKGYKHTDAAKEKMRVAKLGRRFARTEDGRAAIADANRRPEKREASRRGARKRWGRAPLPSATEESPWL